MKCFLCWAAAIALLDKVQGSVIQEKLTYQLHLTEKRFYLPLCLGADVDYPGQAGGTCRNQRQPCFTAFPIAAANVIGLTASKDDD